ncbi:hypothetical protein [Novosphingobium sp.]|uniref:hypothetical protein n=1 Tax=Novosphingobium sp. TaxID=1874826 RepID=UPI002B45CD83|nr:hypothetical protein [Novosphingobium sp.]HKR91656.1 hypothetical protein [Novosphingobium sp.]
MRNIAKILTATVLTMSAGSVLAAPAKAPAKAAPAAPASASASQSQEQDAMLYLKVLISGLQSEKVDQPVKGALVGCLYNNSLGKITESMDKVIAENPGKIDKNNPSQLLGVLARICGYQPEAAPAGSAPAPSGNAPSGR